MVATWGVRLSVLIRTAPQSCVSVARLPIKPGWSATCSITSSAVTTSNFAPENRSRMQHDQRISAQQAENTPDTPRLLPALGRRRRC